MTKVYRILWIEDNAANELSYWAAPVYMAGGYDLVFSFNASEGLAHIQEQEFDAVIVDVRIPPGSGPEWIEIYQEAAEAGREPRLGLQLLYAALGSERTHPRLRSDLRSKSAWIVPSRFAVLTVERRDQEEIQNCIDNVGIKIFFEKRTDTPEKILLDIIASITGEEISEYA